MQQGMYVQIEKYGSMCVCVCVWVCVCVQFAYDIATGKGDGPKSPKGVRRSERAKRTQPSSPEVG